MSMQASSSPTDSPAPSPTPSTDPTISRSPTPKPSADAPFETPIYSPVYIPTDQLTSPIYDVFPETLNPSEAPTSTDNPTNTFPTPTPSPCPSTLTEGMKWIRKKDQPFDGRHHPITFANEKHGYLLTGTTKKERHTKDFYKYDPKKDEWTELKTYTGPRRSYGYGLVLPKDGHGSAYLGFGIGEVNGKVEHLNDWWEYDMANDKFAKLKDFPGPARKHPAMVVTRVGTDYEIHVGLGDNGQENFNDWYSYSINNEMWTERKKFDSTERHHPFYFGLGENAYVGLGHTTSNYGDPPKIERDWYHYNQRTKKWTQDADFKSLKLNKKNDYEIVTAEARVAGTQFSIEKNEKCFGFVLSGDGDDHKTMDTGEFHSFDHFWKPPQDSKDKTVQFSPWLELPPHPGKSRWAPGSFVLRGTTEVYFTSGKNRRENKLHND
eukprot:CAMPEP_0194202286 /NCGR_PEP_ID=MMETSP0156-20130528/2357_1 /TAXON_ID=33649 /ORGANISM="Thalassionema nitzschioides, Strain L26-B" /LENGTH=434 /DNA_ID=CAMNT_0038927743 /DNA_START=150 /DNA_END=1451 /DNA_ORIENTATION=+